MTESEVLEFINELEMLYDVEEWTVNGLHVWPLIRLNIGGQCNASVDSTVLVPSHKKKKI